MLLALKHTTPHPVSGTVDFSFCGFVLSIVGKIAAASCSISYKFERVTVARLN